MYNELCRSVYRARLIASAYLKSPYYDEETAYNLIASILSDDDDE